MKPSFNHLPNLLNIADKFLITDAIQARYPYITAEELSLKSMIVTSIAIEQGLKPETSGYFNLAQAIAIMEKLDDLTVHFIARSFMVSMGAPCFSNPDVEKNSIQAMIEHIFTPGHHGNTGDVKVWGSDDVHVRTENTGETYNGIGNANGKNFAFEFLFKDGVIIDGAAWGVVKGTKEDHAHAVKIHSRIDLTQFIAKMH